MRPVQILLLCTLLLLALAQAAGCSTAASSSESERTSEVPSVGQNDSKERNSRAPAIRGAELFASARLGCTGCHETAPDVVTGFGPNLAGVGNRLSRTKIRKSILNPSSDLAFRYRSLRIQLRSNEDDEGPSALYGRMIEDESNDETLAVESDGQTKLVPRTLIEKVTESSEMPKGLASDLNPQELDDLVQFLFELK